MTTCPKTIAGKQEEVTIHLGGPKKVQPKRKPIMVKVIINTTGAGSQEFDLTIPYNEYYAHFIRCTNPNVESPNQEEKLEYLMDYLYQHEMEDAEHIDCFQVLKNLAKTPKEDQLPDNLSINIYTEYLHIDRPQRIYDTLNTYLINAIEEDIHDLLDQAFKEHSTTDEQIRTILDDYLTSKNIAH